MQLPGGVQAQGRLEKDFHFSPVSGALEMRLHEACAYSRSHPHFVSQALACVLEEVGGQSANIDRVRDLCVADRQYLALQWRLQNSDAQQWLTASCPQCAAYYDFPLQWNLLPIKPAAAEFPFAVAETALGEIHVRAPTGRDQEVIALLPADIDVKRWLTQRLIVSPTHDRHALSDADYLVIDAAIEAMVPEVANAVGTQCPECGCEHSVELDLYGALFKANNELLDDVHRIASVYHWSEAEILALPSERRLQYLQRIDRARGMTGAEQ